MRDVSRWLILAIPALMALVCGCGSSSSQAQLSLPELKYRVMAQVGRPVYCDPDSYPVARALTDAEVRQRVDRMRAEDAEAYAATVRHLGLAGGPQSPSQERAVYDALKQLDALRLTAVETAYAFDYKVGQPGRLSRVTGTVDRSGRVTVGGRQPATITCPICLARGTRIATPAGDVPVQELHAGVLVWTQDAAGARVAAPILRVASTPVPSWHEVVHVALSDGRELWASPGHPTAGGRSVGDLRPGQPLDGATVVVAELVPYTGDRTFDLLPAGPTGYYWAGGILLGSTLANAWMVDA